MTHWTHWRREFWFLARDKAAIYALMTLLVLSLIGATTGLQKINTQKHAIEAMIEADAADRETAQSALGDHGAAGYYSFYITYDWPSPLAFAAFGQRDTAPFMKRIRLLAIEGQIYQGESPNPLLAQIGSLDLAFISAYVLPLILIVLLYDLKAGERAAGRQTMLEAMPGSRLGLWGPRIVWRAAAALLCVAVPFAVGAYWEGARLSTTALAFLGIAINCVFWTVLAALLAYRAWRGAMIAACLVGLWLTLNVLTPLGAQLLFVNQVSGPDGSDVALLQREAVNDAWDKPKDDILTPFAARYPQYAVKEDLGPFDWRWYFAFQTMGDLAAQDISTAYRDAIRRRDDIAGTAAWFSPALALQRHLQKLAQTDVTAQLDFDTSIREYHQTLREFHFPMIFGKADFKREILEEYPRFDPETPE